LPSRASVSAQCCSNDGITESKMEQPPQRRLMLWIALFVRVNHHFTVLFPDSKVHAIRSGMIPVSARSSA
ncbi:MAG: hypothetical protein ABSH20_28875, partial [Tepidisphaeraceae bacterium]